MLSIDPSVFSLPGMELVDPSVDRFDGQVIYLDFDGAEDITYNGPVTVENINVPPFSAGSFWISGCEETLEEVVTNTVADLLAPLHVNVTKEVPEIAEFSTIYVGGTDEAFAAYGNFFGLAEAIDVEDTTRKDNGFVFSDEFLHIAAAPDKYCVQVASVIVHEAAHLLGLAHTADHGFDSASVNSKPHSNRILDHVAHAQGEGKEAHQWITKEAYDFYVSQFDFGNAEGGFGELGRNLVASADPSSPWNRIAADSHRDYDNNVIEGVADEDVPHENPAPGTDYHGLPFLYHFCAGGDADEIHDGLGGRESAYDIAQWYWDNYVLPNYPSIYTRALAYYYLGHVVHLLEDMTVAAHVHNDEHIPVVDPDHYEQTIAVYSNYQLWNYGGTSRSSPTGSISLPSSLLSLFRETVDYTEEYDSNDEDGDDESGIPNTGRHRPDLVSRSGGFTGNDQDLDHSSHNEITILGDDLMPWAIEQVASLFRLFYRAVDTTWPTVYPVNSLSSDSNAPTWKNTDSFSVSCDLASDPQSGIDRDGYYFETKQLEPVDGPLETWGPFAPEEVTIGEFDEGEYRIKAVAWNGAALEGRSEARYFGVDTEADAIPWLRAKTSSGGSEIPEDTWQRDDTAYFYWGEPSSTSPIVGYSYALDGQPDEIIDPVSDVSEPDWEPPNPLNNGTHVFRVMATDAAGWWGPVKSFTIKVDDQEPTNGTISINDGAVFTTSLIVTLNGLDATEQHSGLDKMRFSNDGDSWSSWESYSTSKSNWDLSSYGGNSSPSPPAKTVYVEYKDEAGNVSNSFSDGIEYRAPEVNAGPDDSVDEGDTFSGSGSFVDPWGTSWTVAVDYGDGTNDSWTQQEKTFDLSHVYGDDGNYTVTVAVTADYGGEGTDELVVTVDNVQPALVVDVPPSPTLDEGTKFELIATFSDPGFTFAPAGTQETFTYRIEWGDGTADEGPVTDVQQGGPGVPTEGSFNGSHVYADNRAYPVTVMLRDDDMGTWVADSFTVFVNNVAPTVDAGADQAVDEGEEVTLDPATFNDRGTLDTHVAEIDWGDGIVEPAVVTEEPFGPPGDPAGMNGTVSGTHVYADNGTYVVTVRTRDDDVSVGSWVEDSFTVTVFNVAPTLEAGSNQTANEGQVVSLDPATFNDKGTLDTHTARIDWGDGTLVEQGTVAESPFGPPGSTAGMDGTVSGSHVYADNGTYTVAVWVRDDDMPAGTWVEDSFLMTVNNVVPTVEAGADQTVAEGQEVTLDPATFNDKGTLDTHTARIDWGDGTLVEQGTVAESPFGPPGDAAGMNGTVSGRSGSHVYADNGTYTVTVKVRDDDMPTDTWAEGSFLVTVTNVDPSLWVRGMREYDEGEPFTIEDIGMLTDPGFDNPDNPFHQPGGSRETFTASIDWRDELPVDHPAVVIDMPGEECLVTRGTFDGAHTYLDEGTGRYVATLRVEDDDMGESPDRYMTILVNNVAPFSLVLDPDPLVPVDEGQLATLNGTFEDPGVLDTHTVTVTWGDSETTVELLPVGERSFDIEHLYKDDGLNPGGTDPRSEVFTYDIHVVVDDGDGDQVEGDTSVEVHNVAPELTELIDPQQIDEGELFEAIIGWFTDDGVLDVHDAIIIWDDGTEPDSGVVDQDNDTIWGSHVYADNGVYDVEVTVIDDDGGTDTGSFTITVNNVDPEFLDTVPDMEVVEGYLIILDPIAFKDMGTLDTHTETTIDWGDGNDDEPMTVDEDPYGPPGSTEGMTGTITASHCYADDDLHDPQGDHIPYDVRITLLDDDGREQVLTFKVTVNNVDPTLTVVTNQPVDEGNVLNIVNIGVFDDPGFDNSDNPRVPGGSVETFGYRIDWDDGTEPDTGAATIDVAGGCGVLTQGSFDGSHIYADNGIYTVMVTVVDDDGGEATETFEVTVNNVAPDLTLNLPTDLTIDEGSELGLPGLGTFTDPAFADPDLGNVKTFTYRIDWGDGKVDEDVVNVVNGARGRLTRGTFDGSHIYADNGTYTVIVRVEDDDTDWPPYFDEEAFTVTINNVAPMLWFQGDQTATLGELLDVIDLGQVSDPGFANSLNVGGEEEETFEYTIDWGDNTTPNTGTVTIDVPGRPGRLTYGSFDGSHVYNSVPPDGFYLVTVTVRDDDNGSDMQMFNVTINEPEPPMAGASESGSEARMSAMAAAVPMPMMMMATAAGPDTEAVEADAENGEPTLWGPGNLTGNEGEEIPPDPSDFGSFFDPDSAGPFTYRIEWDDGHVDEGSADIDVPGPPTWGSFDGSHVYADNDLYVVRVTLTDDVGGSTTESFEITVENVAPAVSIEYEPTEPKEGSPVTCTAVVDDPGTADTFTYAWNVTKDGQPYDDGSGNPTDAETFTFTPDDGSDHNWEVFLDVADDDGGPGSASEPVPVENVAPTIELEGDENAYEGSTYTLTLGEITDPGDDTVTQWIVHWGDGSSDIYEAGGEVTHTYADDDPSGTPRDRYTILVDLIDEDGTHPEAGSKEITVHNVEPALANVQATSPINEGQTATLSGDIVDPGSADTFALVVDWGDGSQDGYDYGAGTTSFMETHPYGDNRPGDEPYDVALTLTDDDTGQDFHRVPVIVRDVAPTIELEGDENAYEGSTYTLTLGEITDPGDDAVTQWIVHWGDGSSDIYEAGGEVTHAYADDDPSGTPRDRYTILVDLIDEDGTHPEAGSKEITVHNVEPALANVQATSPINEGQTATLSGDIVDPSSADTFVLMVDWGDGHQEEYAYGPGTTSFEETHLYADNRPGDEPYNVALTLTDDDTGEDSDTQVPVVVKNMPPVAVDDYYVFDGIGTLEVDADEGVLDNDYDPGNDDFWIEGWCEVPDGHLLKGKPDGSFSYQAPDDFSGSVTFCYRDQDDENAISEWATVTIDVGMNASISGHVYATDAVSGFQPSHLPLPGVAVELKAIDGKGVVEINTITDDDGFYKFAGLRAGTYEITDVQPAICLDSAEHVLTPVTVIANQESTNNNFYEKWLRPQSISLGLFLGSRMTLSPPFWGDSQDLREKMALAEEQAGNDERAGEIRLGEVVQVARRGAEVTITGTSLDEGFQFEPGRSQHLVTVDDNQFQFTAGEVSRIKLHSGGGSDLAETSDSDGDDVLSAKYNVAELWSDDFFKCAFFDFDEIHATSDSGGDDCKVIENTIDFIMKTFGDWKDCP